jgi:hypothetical protein
MDRITLGDGKVRENARRSAVRDACAVRAVLSYGGTDQVVLRLAFGLVADRAVRARKPARRTAGRAQRLGSWYWRGGPSWWPGSGSNCVA